MIIPTSKAMAIEPIVLKGQMLMFNKDFNQKYMVKNYSVAKQQKGLVLFIALIALVAMSLAAAALVRSVDSGILVAGNLAFKQSAIMSAETGIADAYRYINVNSAALTADANGYFASFDDTKSLKSTGTWGATNSFLAPTDSVSGNETRYIVQRMCRSAGATDSIPNNCMSGDSQKVASSQASQSYANQDPATPDGASTVYRVTVRVVGPKNTTSYLQAFIY